MDTLTSDFLAAYNEIDRWLRNQSDSPHRLDFPVLVDSISATHNGVKRRNHLLKEINKLRNLIVHHFSRSNPFAVPAIYAVEQIVALRDEFLAPPSLLSLATSPVEQRATELIPLSPHSADCLCL